MRASLFVGALVTAVILVLAPGASADQMYSDPAGDATGGAPDITQVRVSNDATGQISFDITVPLPEPDFSLSGVRTIVGLFLDTDMNRETGDEGDEYGYQYLANAGTGLMVRAGEFLPYEPATLKHSYTNGVLHIEINKSDLGNTEAFSFWVAGLLESGLSITEDYQVLGTDLAPDGTAVWAYTLTEPTPPAAPLKLTGGKPKALKAPQAGKPFTVVMPVKRSDGAAFTKAKVSGKMKIGAKTLKATGRVVKGTARCSTRIPKGTKGKVLRGTITAQVGTAKVTKTFAFKIR